MNWTWTAAKTEEARRLYFDELCSASRVAKLIGAPTRNTVIGQMRRHFGKKNNAADSRLNQSLTLRAKARARRAEAPPRPTKVLNLRPDTLVPRHPRTLVDRPVNGCKWPIDALSHRGEILFCCEPRDVGRNYCQHHQGMLHQSGGRP